MEKLGKTKAEMKNIYNIMMMVVCVLNLKCHHVDYLVSEVNS